MKKIIFYLILLFSNDILSNEITILDDISGQGLEIINHTKVKVHYIGKFEDGTEFDNSYKRGKPISFQLGIRLNNHVDNLFKEKLDNIRSLVNKK